MHKVLPSVVVRMRTRNGSIRHRSINTGVPIAKPTRTGSRSCGMTVNRKADVSGSMIIRSTKFAVIISLSYLNCDKRMSAMIIASDRNPAMAGRRNNASQKKFSSAQASRKVAFVARSSSVAAITTSAVRCTTVMTASANASRRDIASAGAKRLSRADATDSMA